MPEPGETFAGKYVILRRLGEGGMGVVYEALHRRLKKRVAIKVLQNEALQSPDVVARFEREARTAEQLKGPHVARVLDVDNLPDGAPFMVMELLEGVDLAAEMEARPIPLSEAVGYILEACAAMSEAHALGIVHRDLKPGNLFIAEQGERRRIKILDFGISKLSREREVSVTSTQSTLGTPLYMSPEQIRSAKTVDARSDIWSLGVILYELLAGRTPFYELSASAVVAAIAADPVPSIGELRPDLPPELAAAVMKALEKDPARRFQAVEDFAEAIGPFSRLGRVSIGSFSDAPPPRASQPRLAAKALVETLPALERGARPSTTGEEALPPVKPEQPAVAAWTHGSREAHSGRKRWTLVAIGGIGLGVLVALASLRGSAATDPSQQGLVSAHGPGGDIPQPEASRGAVPAPAEAPAQGAQSPTISVSPVPLEPAVASGTPSRARKPHGSPKPPASAAPVAPPAAPPADTVTPLHL